MKPFPSLRTVLVAVAMLSPVPAVLADDLESLTDGVSSIRAHGVPGPVVAFTREAFPVLIGKWGDHQAPLAVASRLGRGRVLAFGHTGYLDAPEGDARRLLDNALRWLSSKRDLSKIRVGVHGVKSLKRYLPTRGVTVREAAFRHLDGLDVLVMSAFALRTDKEMATVSKFVRRGGGLMTAATGWAYTTYIEKGKDLVEDFRGNRLLRPAGIAFTTDILKPFGDRGFVAAGARSERYDADRALTMLQKHDSGTRKLDPAVAKQVAATLGLAMRAVPVEGHAFAKKMDALLRSGIRVVRPTARSPVHDRDLLERIRITWSTLRARRLPIKRLKAHPTASIFPGAVPLKAPRVTRSVKIDTRISRWHSTGLYAAPGKAITVTVPKSAVGARLRIRIGAHKDRLWKKSTWKRCPEITRTFPITGSRTRAACAFGGLVYIEIPRECPLETISVRVAGAVEAPLYLHGRTSVKDWRRTIRKHPAPWAEIGSNRWIMTVPSATIRNLDDPAALMKTWDRGLDLVAELARRPKERPYPERIVFDVQISAGFMHSGYPIMAHVPRVARALDPALVRNPEKTWGFWHELGHNHQHRSWTFSGTGEVTCNLFTLYVGEKLGGVPPSQNSRTSSKARLKQMKRFFAQNPTFDTWKSRPFLALAMYVQLQQEFGWDPFLKVFEEYRDLPRSERPRSDDEKRDQWLVRFSRAVGRNLGPFFETWRVPTRERARRSIEDLPPWMPDELLPFKK